MTDKKISELASAGTLTGSELAPVVQSGSTVKLALSALLTWITTQLASRLLPAGGTTGQALAKTSSTDYAVSWQDVQAPLPTTTLPGYVLTQQSTVAGDIDWQAPGEGLPAYTAPDDNGKVVMLVAGIPSWQTPSGGTTYRQTLSATRRT